MNDPSMSPVALQLAIEYYAAEERALRAREHVSNLSSIYHEEKENLRALDEKVEKALNRLRHICRGKPEADLRYVQ